jgi:hypothetical protein
LCAKAVCEVVEYQLVHVGAAELGIAARGLHLEHAFAELHDRHIEGAAAEIDDRNAQFLTEAVKAIGERGGGRLIDQPHHL